jgi:flagellar assembly protein FliH
MSLSSLLRGDAVGMVEVRPGDAATPLLRMVGTRVLRGEHVGLQKPVPLNVPSANGAGPGVDTLVQPEELAPPPPPPPDFAALEDAARITGYNAGYAQGHAAGVANAEESMSESVKRLVALANDVHENHAVFYRSAERQVVDLALQIAQKVVEHEVENIPDLAIHVIRAALEEMDARTAVRVRVSPDDEELLRRRWAQVVPAGISADRIELIKDEQVRSGGAIIETNHGQVDAQLETKLAELGNALWTFVVDVSTPDPDSDANA